jgi:hypothetical protein
MSRKTVVHRTIALSFAAVLGLGLVACEDEDGDGAETDEEVNELDEKSEDVGNDVEDEVRQGSDEVND